MQGGYAEIENFDTLVCREKIIFRLICDLVIFQTIRRVVLGTYKGAVLGIADKLS